MSTCCRNWRKPPDRVPWRWLGLAWLMLACGGLGGIRKNETTGTRADSASNVTREDFVGSRVCAGCHFATYEKWQHSPMHRMTRRMAMGQARAPFDSAEFRLGEDVARMVTATGQHYMQLRSARYSSGWYRITKVIGGRYREDYAGVRVNGPVPEATQAGDERILPVSYLLFSNEWRYKGYSVMSPERDGLRRGLKWNQSCIFCHNTAPWLSLHYDELHGLGAPSYQGAASLELPNDRELAYRITDESDFETALADEFSRLGAAAPSGDGATKLLEEASEVTRQHFSERHLVELGIGCEACHGGGRAHVANPGGVLPSPTPQSSFLETTTKAGGPIPKALGMTHSCAKCHTVLFSRYPYTWEGGERGFSPGGSNMNSGEARDFLLGACTSQLACSSCHDPHAEDDPRTLENLSTVRGNSVCTTCHTHLKQSSALTRHTRHTSESEGSACVACHMPQKNVGLDYDLTRYHRIGSPTDQVRVEKDRPLECALCHADKSIIQLVSSMERFWNKRFNRKQLKQLYGDDLNANALTATLEHGKPHEQVVAIHVSGRAEQKQNLGLIVQQLEHEYPLLRFFARDAVQRLTGRKLDVDMHAPGKQLKQSVLRKLSAVAPKADNRPAAATTSDAAP